MQSYRPCKCDGCTNILPKWSRKFFCSKACKMKDYRKRKTPHYDVRNNPYPKWCRTCGNKFNALHPYAMYCNRACKQRFWREQQLLNADVPRQLEIPESAYTISNVLT